MLAKLAIFLGLSILVIWNPLLCLALALLWWGSGVLARRQGLLPADEQEETEAAPAGREEAD